jgi:hypothetical protein
VVAFLILAGLFGLVGLALAVSIECRFDTRERRERRWRLSWAGVPLPLPGRSGRRKRPARPGRRARRFGLGILRDRVLLRVLLQAGRRAVRDVVRAVHVGELDAVVSLPDPMWNGILFGLFGDLRRGRMHVSIAFEGRSWARGRIRVRPIRFVPIVARLLLIVLRHRARFRRARGLL